MAALSINQTPRAAPPLSPDPIENKVLKTWQVGTKSFRLLRIGDQLEGELILPVGKHVRSPIPFPPNLSIEEAILNLMARTPVECSDGSIALETPEESANPIENEVLKKWQVGRKYFHLLRRGDQLEGEFISPFGEHVRSSIPFPPNLSIEDAILDLTSRTPVEYPDGSITLETPEQWVDPPRAHEPGQPGIFRSLLDPETLIDDNRWSVTLVDTLRPQLFDPKTWGGHAAILIEGVEKGTFFLKKAHLMSGFRNTGEISLTRVPIKHFEIGRIAHQSPSWILSPTRAQYMLDHIEKEEAEIRAGRLKITLNPIAKGDDPRVQNCFLWARDQLRWGGIELYRGNPEVPFGPFQVPARYFPNELLSPKGVYSIFSKAQATVYVESADGKFHTGIDITETLATKLGGLSWKIAKETGKGWPIIPDGKAILEGSDPKIVFRDPVVVSVQIAGKPGLRRIDVTETVKKGVAKQLGLEEPGCTML